MEISPDGGPPRARDSRLWATIAGTLRMSWRASPRGFAGALAVTLAAALVPPAVLWVSKRFVDLVAGAQGTRVPAGRLIPTALALGLLGAAQRIFQALQNDRQQVFSRQVGLYADEQFIERASRTDMGHLDDPGWHDRMTRASRDLNFRPFNVTWSVIGLAGNTVTLAGVLGVLWTVHPILLLLALGSVLIPVPLQRRVLRRLYDFFFETTAKEREQYYLRQLLTDTRSAKDVRALVLEDHLLGRFHDLAWGRYRLMARLYALADRYSIVAGLLSGASLSVAYVFVAVRGAAGTLSPGAVTALIGAVAGVTAQVGMISQGLVMIEQNAQFLADYFDFLRVERLIPVPAVPASLPVPMVGGIRFEGATFSYAGRPEPAVAGVDLHIRDGELIALVGDNGAGKTTLVKLLLRFYDPQGGAVRVGGVDLRAVDPAVLRDRIGVLFQDYTNFTFTARESVRLGRANAAGRAPGGANDGDGTGDERIWAALQAARAEEIVRRLPRGLDSVVGRLFEGGQDLSGGEWQRLALARLIFRNADIWILDEPTSSLDPEAEAAIFAELKEQLAGRIGIVISHRFSTVRIADRIAVMQEGRITELGTHEELIALGGRYAELFELQATAYR